MTKILVATMTIFSMTCFAYAEEAVYGDAAGLHASQQCLLHLVRGHMGVTKPSALNPILKLENEIPLSEYQDAMESFWKFRPDVFGNVYDVDINTIFLMTNLKNYTPPRSPMESLVHELAHFVQINDMNGASGDPDILEGEAVKVQEWFRTELSKNIVDGYYKGTCP